MCDLLQAFISDRRAHIQVPDPRLAEATAQNEGLHASVASLQSELEQAHDERHAALAEVKELSTELAVKAALAARLEQQVEAAEQRRAEDKAAEVVAIQELEQAHTESRSALDQFSLVRCTRCPCRNGSRRACRQVVRLYVLAQV